MSADHIAWRVEHYEKMGFSYAESVTLANTLDDKDFPLYWGDVANLLTATKWNHALTLDMLVALPPKPTLVYDDAEPSRTADGRPMFGGADDGA